MRLISFLLAFAAIAFANPSYSHSIPTHLNMTTAAVEYLTKTKALTCTAAQKKDLTDLLRIGTEHEDDWGDPKDHSKARTIRLSLLAGVDPRSCPVGVQFVAMGWPRQAKQHQCYLQLHRPAGFPESD